MKNAALPSCGQDLARGSWLPDRGNGVEDFRDDTGGCVGQARQEVPEPGEQQAAVVSDGAEDGVDGVALPAVEVVPFKQAVGLHVAEHGKSGRLLRRPQQGHPAATVAEYCSGAYIRPK